jgi:glutaredoxin
MGKKIHKSGSKKRSNDDIENLLVDKLGIGPMRFGPVLQELTVKEEAVKSSRDEIRHFVDLKVAWEADDPNKSLTDEQILRFARFAKFNRQKALSTMKKADPSYCKLTAAKLKEQLDTKTIFPIPGLRTSASREGNRGPSDDTFYMNASRITPSSVRDMVNNLVYVMECMYERRRSYDTGMALIANFTDFEMSNFSADCCHKFMQALQGRVAPVKASLFLIVNPPPFFDKVWKIMKPMLSADFVKITHMIGEDELWQFFDLGFEEFLPNEFIIGNADTDAIVQDFVAYRLALEDATGRNETKKATRKLGRKIKAVLAGLDDETSSVAESVKARAERSEEEIHLDDTSVGESGISDDIESGVGKGPAQKVVITDILVYEGASVGEKIDAIIEKHLVVMFEKTWCPFCASARRLLLEQIGVNVHLIQLDVHPLGKEMQKSIANKTKHKTVPAIYINGEFLGGFEDVNALHDSGELEKHLTQADRCELEMQSAKSGSGPLFWFPEKVNAHAIRATGILTSLAAMASAAMQLTWAPYGAYFAYVILFDFFMRILAGSFLSPLGRIAGVLVSCWEPKPRMGKPKQFAACCGFTFALLGSLFYSLSFDHHNLVGAGSMAMLSIACGMEGFIDFCLGCFFFKIGIQIGVFSAN